MERIDRGNEKVTRPESIISLLKHKSDGYEKRTAFYLYENRQWTEATYEELSTRARALSNYLIEKGVKQGERVAILSESRPEWVVAFFAAIWCGAIIVPLDAKLTSTELFSILSDAEPRLLFVSAQLAETARVLKSQLPFLEEIILLNRDKRITDFQTLDDLRASSVSEGRERDPDETALIVYTSGTTGKPKGVMITFRNLLFQCKSFERVMKISPNDLFLSILPLNHLFELSTGLLGVLYTGARICYCNTLYPHEIAQIMRDKRVTRMVTVPLFLKMLKGSIEKEIHRAGARRERMFQTAFGVAQWIPVRSVRRFLFRSIHKQLGGRLKEFICGGARLDIEVARFFDRLGIGIYQGYGLTETSPVISVNTPEHNRLGSVGRPLLGVQVRLLKNGADEKTGEILTKGPHVMKGYYKSEDLTREVIDEEGWFHTGDVGKIDEGGFLYITGRIKNLIVLGSGKKVHPEEVETIISKSPIVKEVCVLGRLSQEGLTEGTEGVCAVVVPADSLTARLRERPEALEEEIKKEIDRLSQALASYKRPSKVFIRFEELPKTSTRKIKRALVLEWLNRQEESIRPAQINSVVRSGESYAINSSAARGGT